MCGRIGLPQLTWAQFVAWQNGDLDWDEIHRDPAGTELRTSWNVKPTQDTEILLAHGNSLVSTLARWWFVPHWFGGAFTDWKGTTFNARIETAHELKSFNASWKTARCALPVSGYFEWTGAKGAKQPWWLSAETNAPGLLMAGLYSQHRDGRRTCTILTRPALPQIAHIHARTPVILSPQDVRPWLTGEMDHADAMTLGDAWDGRMTFHKVHKFGIADDGPELIEPM